MKANELMLGDWVVYRGDAEYTNPVRIEGMDIRTNALITEDREDVGFDGIEPIPLTAEILEKNGWYIPEDGLWYRHDMIPFLIALRTSGAYLYADEEHDKREFFCSIHSVHELQHVLHLCGIDYEIKL